MISVLYPSQPALDDLGGYPDAEGDTPVWMGKEVIVYGHGCVVVEGVDLVVEVGAE